MRRDLILNYLMSKNKPISSEKLEYEFSISGRTLRNEIKILNEIGKDYNFEVTRLRGQGYVLNVGNAVELRNYLEDVTDNGTPDLKGVRVNNIIVILLQTKDFITIESFTERLMVSRSTVISDLTDVEKIVDDFNLSIERKSHYGVRLVGDEICLRRALSFFLKQNEFGLQKQISYEVFEANYPAEAVRSALSSELSNRDIKISYFAFENILSHIMVLAFRVSCGNYILDGQEQRLDSEVIKEQFMEPARKVCELISKLYSVQMPESEVTYLAAHICGKSSADVSEEKENNDIKEKLTYALEKLDVSFCTNFSKDTQLIESLALHMYPLLNRLYFNLTLTNPLIESLYCRYSHIFLITINFSEIIKDVWGFELSKDEIGYLAMHFATHLEREKQKQLGSFKKILLVFENAGASVSLVVMKLKSVFNEAEVTVVQGHNLCDVEQSDYDLMVSAVPIDSSNINIPYFRISNIPTDRDLQKIKGFASKYPSVKFGKAQSIISMFYPELFSIETDKEYMQILEEKAQQAVDLKFAKSEFPALVFEREAILSTVFQEGIAVPHPLKMNANKGSISVAVLKKPIYSDGKAVNLIFLVNLYNDTLYLHTEITKIILHLIENPIDKQKLIKAKDFEEFHFELSKILLKGII